MLQYIVIVFIAITPKVQSVKTQPLVHIGLGSIIGKSTTINDIKVNEFLGVPYAKPPLGDLRFRKPIPLPLYKSTIRATKLPPACPQYSKIPYPSYFSGPEKSEDCLYLNIWTPANASPSKKKAVLYWIHKGAFRYGSISDETYYAAPLAGYGDIIVVTVGYRLGPFGFLFSGTEDAPGNAGLWDILLGLKWVNENIHAFGGDRTRITIAGSMSGAEAVGILSLSPAADELFSRIIMQSGSPEVPVVDGKTNLDLSQNVSSIVGCADEKFTIQDHPKKVTKCLRALDYKRLSEVDSRLTQYATINFSPQKGDSLIPEDIKSKINNGIFKCKDLLTGVTQGEGTSIVSSSYPDVFGLYGQKNTKISKTEAEKLIKTFYSVYTNNTDAIEEVTEYYLKDGQSKCRDFYRNQASNAVGDLIFTCPTAHFAEKCALTSEVFFYYWRHRPRSSDFAKWEGATDGSEVEFIFGRPLLFRDEYLKNEIKLSLQMIQLWSNFIKYGYPTKDWPLYTGANPVVMNLGGGKTLTEETGPHIPNCVEVKKAVGIR